MAAYVATFPWSFEVQVAEKNSETTLLDQLGTITLSAVDIYVLRIQK